MPKATPSQKATINGLLKKLLILRDGEKCLKCHKTERLQMSHIYPKGHYRKMEFDEQNLKLLCVGCHLYWWHRNPMEAQRWLKSVLSPERLDYLHMRSNVIDKTPFDYQLTKLVLERDIREYEKVLSHKSPKR